MPDKKLYLIDGTSLCYRSYFAISLSNSSGLPTGAVYGFYRTLKKLIAKQNPEFIGVCFDVSRKTHRQEKYKDYKLHRPELPEALKVQFSFVERLVKSLGVKIVKREGFEADDVIASLCKDARKKGMQVVVVSSDKDFYQLLADKGVAIYNYKEQKFYQQKEFIKRYGFEPAYMVDYLALAGDASDNIPGARGIGKVTAAKLIKEFGSIDNIFKNLDKVSLKISEKLNLSKKDIALSKELVLLSEPELNIESGQLRREEVNKKELAKLFSELEFKMPRDDLFGQPQERKDSSLPQVKKGAPLDLFEGKLERQIIYTLEQDYAYIYLPKDKTIYKEEREKIESLLRDPFFEKISFNLKKQMLQYPQIGSLDNIFDIKIAAYLVDSAISDYSLVSLVSLFLGEHHSKITFELSSYFIWRLYQALGPRLEKDQLARLFYSIEMPLIRALSKMESNGIAIDSPRLEEVLKKVNKKIDTTEKLIFKTAKKEFNLNSPKQLQEVLFTDLGIKPLKKTKTGFSTNESVLKELSFRHPIAKDILQYRELSKLKTTYLSPLGKKVETSGSKLFTHFHQTGTQTGRLSSSDPNLQSIPMKGEFSADLRAVFISSYPEGFIVAADYSQIELRILAHLSQDKNLIKAFNQGLDIHSFTASLLYGIDEDRVEVSQRNIAKKVNFGIVYGMSPYGLSKELGMTIEEAENFIQSYFCRYPGVAAYIEKTIDQAEKKGYVKTVFGRRRSLAGIHSPNPHLKDFAKRQAVNAPIQGSCADIIKLAMVKIDREVNEAKMPVKLIMQIHDELVFDSSKKSLNQLISIAKKEMENCFSLAVPLEVNIKAGKNWGETKNVEKD